MTFLSRTIFVFVTLSLAVESFAPAEESSERGRQTLTISGSVGLPGVTMTGLPDNPVTDIDGTYKATVEYGWSGTVTPTKEGFTFNPPSRSYVNVISSQTYQDYIPEPITFTISGTAGKADVLMHGLPGHVVTDASGNYSAAVPYGWSGTVTPTKEGCTFEPRSRTYASLMGNQTNQSYIVTSITGLARAVGRAGRRKVLVIPTKDVKAEDLDEITQDLHVMSYILDEKFKEPRSIAGVFTDFGDFFGRDNRETEAIYLQGYGVLFLMEVNFTFSPPPEPQQKQAEQMQEYLDLTWQRARRELFSPGKLTGRRQLDSPEGYDVEMVEELKRELIRTLKHASNIRSLKPDEWIIVTVIGEGRQAGRGFEYEYFRNMSRSPSRRPSRFAGAAYGAAGAYGGYGGYGGGAAAGSAGFGFDFGGRAELSGMGAYYGETVLTIRAKKSDVDAFAKAELDFEQFQQKVQIFTY